MTRLQIRIYCVVATVLGLAASARSDPRPKAPVTVETESEAVATFDSYDASGTIETVVEIQALTVIQTQSGQPPVVVRQVGIEMFVLDHKTNHILLTADGSNATAAPPQLEVNADLTEAHLKAAVILTDATQSNFNAEIDARWQIGKNPEPATRTIATTTHPLTVTTSGSRQLGATGVVSVDPSPEYPQAIENATPAPALVGDDQTELFDFLSVSE